MNNNALNKSFAKLNTAQIADACVRLGVDFMVAPRGIEPLVHGTRLAGRVRPVKHYGSVDLFFEAMLRSEPGEVLVIDNKNRDDEGCIGDLTAIEAKACGLAGIIVWGFHRDTVELIQMAYPVFSYGSCPIGPLRVDPADDNALEEADFGGHIITEEHVVFADSDGVIFANWNSSQDIISVAEKILETEQNQAETVRQGVLMRDQLQFEDYLNKRKLNPDYTFRKHLRTIDGAIEE